MKIPRLDRYMAVEIIWPFAAALGFLFALFVAMQLLRGIDVMLGAAVRPVDVARILGYLTPFYLALAMPVAYLFALMLAVGRWSDDREVLALAASGISPWRLVIAPIALGLLVAGAGIYIGRGPGPTGLASLKLHVNELIKRKLAGDVPAGVFYDNLRSITLYAQSVSPKTRRFTNVMLSDERDPSASLVVLAREGNVDPHGGGESLNLILKDGEIHRSGADSGDYALVTFRGATLNIDVGGDLLKSNRFGATGEDLTPRQLESAVAKAVQEGRTGDSRALSYAFHRRWSNPLAAVALTLCGVPLAIQRRKRSRAIGALATLIAYVCYYVAARVAELAAEAGSLPPALAANVANLVFVSVGILLMWRAAKVEA